MFEEWLLLTREQLHQQVLIALHQLAVLHFSLNNLSRVQWYAQQQIELDPWRESAHEQLIRASAMTGQRSVALAQYEACRQILADELGVEPNEALVQLYEQVRSGEITAVSTPPPKHLHNLPAQLTPLIGRTKEIDKLHSWLQDQTTRLINIVGPGGVGKTRLALAVAATQMDYKHGTWLIPLSKLSADLTAARLTDRLVTIVADTINFQFSGQADRLTQLYDYLRDKEMLLVVDNFEHLLAGTDFFMTLLRKTPSVKVLMTSRVQLNVSGEQVLWLDGLPVPPETAVNISDYNSIQLFVTAAQRQNAMFELGEENQSDICKLWPINGRFATRVRTSSRVDQSLHSKRNYQEHSNKKHFPHNPTWRCS